MKCLLAKKLEMTQLLGPKNEVLPVTKVLVLPCYVIGKKIKEKDGYSAVVTACDEIKNTTQPLAKFFEKILGGPKYYRIIKEFRIAESDPMFDKLAIGQKFGAEIFSKGDEVAVSGCSKGRGFQGVVKRHGFSGAPKTHGNKDQLRMPGSIGATHPNHVFKGVRMAGHMGDAAVTIKGLKIIDADLNAGILYIKGGVPGARNSLLEIVGNGDFEVSNIAKAD